jgi:hypothetical protein
MLLGATVLLAATPGRAAESVRFTVTTNLLAPKPISPLLYGNFIEPGYACRSSR